MNFIYILAGWKGSASDARVLHNALSRSDDPLLVPHGKYYVVDAGYAHSPGFMAPYRGVRYHLQEYRTGRAPANMKELFNYRHAQLRNAIERCFGVMKGRFPILKTAMQYEFPTQIQIVIACCVLHNFIRTRPESQEEMAYAGVSATDGESNPTPHEVSTNDERQWLLRASQREKDDWNCVRDAIANKLWEDAQQNSGMPDRMSSDPSTPIHSPAKTPVVPTRSSPRTRTAKSLAEPASRASKIKWTPDMDQVMIDIFLEQVALGRKGDNGFKREAYQSAADAVTKHTNVVLKWQNVSNRLRYYKREYIAVKDMLSASGFGWDNERMVVTTPDEVWEEYIKV
ncbi:uncharacterized protein LOC131254087 [Magnolia sinica]|uniref:uncharacterized protein LOC131254087 n=1 Tax=Magnolia sinica TaxID=86752 RepID=UPI0026599390|nr:uncharacterized protein LOC131254087 [Magnolia sinica]